MEPQLFHNYSPANYRYQFSFRPWEMRMKQAAGRENAWMGPLLRKEIHLENRPRTGHALTCLLCLGPGPLWEFFSVRLTILQGQELAELFVASQKISYLLSDFELLKVGLQTRTSPFQVTLVAPSCT